MTRASRPTAREMLTRRERDALADWQASDERLPGGAPWEGQA